MEGHKNTRERSGGFMIARTHAELVAALPDEEAGRILKGLIYEFWGCGEKPAVSENPLVSALYNSIVQTAKEIDDNYQAQREQKREAGKKSAKARTALNAVDKCSNGVQLNKSKENKPKENKENEINKSKSVTPPSAVLTPEQRKILVDEYGNSAVEAYVQKFERWKASKKDFNGDAFVTISKWMSEDKPKNKSTGFSSFNTADIEKMVSDKYRQLADS